MRRFLALGFLLIASFAFSQTVTFNPTFAVSGTYTPLVQASDGNFYAPTIGYGSETCSYACLEQVTPTGSSKLLGSLPNPNNDDFPGFGSLIEGPDGNFYGLSQESPGFVYKVTPAGVSTILHTFCSQANCPDGSEPYGSLIVGSDSYLYGVTSNGGYCPSGDTCTNGVGGGGVIFKISVQGAFSVVYTFAPSELTCSSTYSIAGFYQGENPVGPLVQGIDGNFYGLTQYGGPQTASGNCNNGPYFASDGTLFQLAPGGVLNTIYEFGGYNTGVSRTEQLDVPPPVSQGPDGQFYGAVYQVPGGGLPDSLIGYAVNVNGTLSPLGTLGNIDDGATAWAWASDSNAYFGIPGASIDKYSTGSGLTIYDTENWSDESASVQGSDGALYGSGAPAGGGTTQYVYRLSFSPALPAPVQLSLSASSLLLGQSVTLNWSVLNAFSMTMQQCYAFVQNSASGAGNWTGLQAGTYANNVLAGAASLTPTAAGTYTYALTCGGVESGFATLNVLASKRSSVTALKYSPNPATVGQTVTLTATVSSSVGTPTGSLTFSVYGNAISTVSLSNGSANLTVPTYALPVGTYPIVATYSGSSTYNASSATTSVGINSAPTTTTLTANPNPVTSPADVTFTAIVSRSATEAVGTPTGSVTFYFGATALDTAKLNSSGVATYTVPTASIPAGSYAISAKYSGDSSDEESTAAAVTAVVN